MAVLLRLSGVPARLVGGYRGGYYNQAGGYYMIPQKNAHVWVEAFFEHRGWVRLDPTPAAQENYVSPAEMGLLFRIRLAVDAINYYWNALVINYDLEKQFTLFQNIGEGLRVARIKTPWDKTKAMHYALALLFIAGSVLLTRYVLRRAKKPVPERLLASFLTKMHKRGYARRRSQGLEEFAASISDNLLRDKARRFAEAFEGFYYRDRLPTKEEVTKLKRMIKDW